MTTLPNLKARLREELRWQTEVSARYDVDESVVVAIQPDDLRMLLDALDSKDEVSDAQVEAAWQELAPPNRPSHDDVRAALRAAWGVK